MAKWDKSMQGAERVEIEPSALLDLFTGAVKTDPAHGATIAHALSGNRGWEGALDRLGGSFAPGLAPATRLTRGKGK